MRRLGGETRATMRFWSVLTLVLLGIGAILSFGGGGDWAGRIWDVAGGAFAQAKAQDARNNGYYEDLLNAGEVRGGGAWFAGPAEIPTFGWLRLHETDGVIWDDPFQRFRLRPNANLDYKGAPLGVNADGLRDRPVDPDPDVRRVAFVGASILMGSGVPVDLVFENRIEDLVDTGAFGARSAVQFLNFGVAGYRIDQLADVVERRIAAFEPDAVVFIINDLGLNPNWSRHLVRLLTEGRDLRYDYLREVVEEAGVDGDQPGLRITAGLKPYRDRVFFAALELVDEWCRRRDLPLIFLVVAQPSPTDTFSRRFAEVRDRVAEIGRPIVDITDAFDDVARPESLWIRPWDRHPTAEGHALMANRLEDAIRSDDVVAEALLGPVLENANGDAHGPGRP